MMEHAVIEADPLDTFPRKFPIDEKLQSCGQQVVVWNLRETTRHNKHNGLLLAPTCYGLVVYVADLLRGNWCNGF